MRRFLLVSLLALGVAFFLIIFLVVYFRKTGCGNRYCDIGKWALKSVSSRIDGRMEYFDPFPHALIFDREKTKDGLSVDEITLYAKVESRVEGTKWTYRISGLNGQNFQFDFGDPRLSYRVDESYGYLDTNKLRSEYGGIRASIRKGVHLAFTWSFLSEYSDRVIENNKLQASFLDKVLPKFISLVYVDDYK